MSIIFLGQGKFLIEDINVHMCTHVVYSFVVLNTQKFGVKIFDQWLDIDLKNYDKFVAMKKKNPKLKVLGQAHHIFSRFS